MGREKSLPQVEGKRNAGCHGCGFVLRACVLVWFRQKGDLVLLFQKVFFTELAGSFEPPVVFLDFCGLSLDFLPDQPADAQAESEEHKAAENPESPGEDDRSFQVRQDQKSSVVHLLLFQISAGKKAVITILILNQFTNRGTI